MMVSYNEIVSLHSGVYGKYRVTGFEGRYSGLVNLLNLTRYGPYSRTVHHTEIREASNPPRFTNTPRGEVHLKGAYNPYREGSPFYEERMDSQYGPCPCCGK